MAESNPAERREIRRGTQRREMTRFPPLPPFPMLITAFVLLWDGGLHARRNVCVNHGSMSLRGYKKERFSSTKSRCVLCSVAP